MRKNFILIVILILFANVLKTQNLVTNGNFLLGNTDIILIKI